MLLTSGPCTGRAIYGTGTTSDTLIGIANDLSVHHGESSYRTTAAVLHALFAAYATGRIILGLGLTDNTEVIQACMRTVIGTTGAGNLYVVIIGEDHLIDFRCQFCHVGKIQCPLDGIPVTRSKDLGKGKSAVTSV